MQSPQELLHLMSTIAEPCESIRRKAVDMAAGNEEPADMRQASADLAATIDHMFEIARYMLKHTSAKGSHA
ncbi:hypothetical protein GAO09_10265 [Rhizobiales bacterium RZME27]|uniref:Uncharacterized protein n=1 Tax=Endobacterium cereale TaxID=2663029 RepID=A0A6A8A960_9HYPH|nr:hypothetical protein [Endobacterium cereale]MEB2846647.1 hypothetical protein [Endobacterium cereale]MQY46428.1 hypothetical protein [Endobacterium cereale]